MKTFKSDLLFNLTDFDIRLDTEWLGRQFQIFEELDSTNTYLLSDESNELQNGAVVLAEKQFQGKGRLDRTWYSGKGLDLTFSILINDPQALRVSLPAVNLGTAVVVAQTVSSLFQIHPAMKWPNDVLISGKKMAGILLETSYFGKKLKKLVIGVGINVNQNNFQGEYRVPPTSLALEIGEHIQRERVLAMFLNLFEEMFETALRNPALIFNDWRARCPVLGDRITINQNEKIITGVFEDIDSNGNLQLRVNEKLITINNGELVL